MDASAEPESPGIRWDHIWSQRDLATDPARFVVSAAGFLPDGGRALDVAGGTGRHAVWLAARGFAVTLVDASEVALAKANTLARDRRVSITTAQRDLEADGLPPGRWGLLLMHHFFDRGLLASTADALEPGGILIFCQPTLRNLERHERPGRRFLLEEGELADLVAPMPLEVLFAEEGWGSEGRHEARLVAKRRS
jgi:SAM-dependent methyltransferase